MNNSDIEAIKKIIASNGYTLIKNSYSFKTTLTGYEKSECYKLHNSNIVIEFHYFENGKDVINAVSKNINLSQSYYFRQIAIGKIWLIIKSNWSNINEVDFLMSKILNPNIY